MALRRHKDPGARDSPPPSYAEATTTGSSDHNVQRARDTTLGGDYAPSNDIAAAASNPPLYSSSASLLILSTPAPAATAVFPPAFNVYAQTCNGAGRSRRLVIAAAETSESRPLYAVSLHSLLSTKPDLVIHGSAVEGDGAPALASIIHDPLSRSATIILPSSPERGSDVPSLSLAPTNPHHHELLVSIGTFPRVLFFGVEIPNPLSRGGRGRSHREAFEWRRSSGADIEALGTRHSGWKLVRMSTSTPRTTVAIGRYRTASLGFSLGNGSENSGGGGVFGDGNSRTTSRRRTHGSIAYPASRLPVRKYSTANLHALTHGLAHAHGNGLGYGYGYGPGYVRNPGYTSDGKEVVAVWAPGGGSVFAATTKDEALLLRFKFVGAGADGSLGERWAIMAVASALAIWHRERRTRHAGLATASF
ncbi:hypothetical protein F4777DRAFT_600420 [Nemania sp. FL0916]|nr:hypothetical protein F4777DRAFT_600420 [Nemania sp. FL0916]